jgi:hypothetical protein
MPRKLRKGRERCGATRRDGQPCEAPAVAEMLVCRAHGGSAPQVLVVSRHRDLQLRYFLAEREWMEARGTKGADAALTRHGNALSNLRAYEERLSYLRDLQAEARRRRAEGSYIRSTGDPPIVRLGKLERRAAEVRRWKPRAAVSGRGDWGDPMEASPFKRA